MVAAVIAASEATVATEAASIASGETTVAAEPASIASAEATSIKVPPAAKIASAVIPTTPPVEPASAVPAAIVTTSIVTAPVKAIEPRARTDKDAVREIVRTPVAIRRAIIWVIPVVTVSASRGCTYVARAYSNAHNHSLCVRRNRGRKHEDGQESQIF